MTPELVPSQSELNQWVGPELTQQAGFRPESSGWFIEDKDFSCRIYAGFIPNPKGESTGLHMVAGVKVREGNKITWYFETFEAPSWVDMSQEEAERYLMIERRTLNNNNVIQPQMLETLIRQTLESYQDK